MNKFLPLISTFLFFGLLLGSCKKAEDLEVDSEAQSVIDYTLAHQEFSTLPSIIYKMLMRTNSATTKMFQISAPSMQYVSGDTIEFLQAPVFSCGAQQIVAAMPDGNIRTGAISVSISSPINKPGAVLTATLTDYTANGITYYAAVLSMTTVGESNNYVGVQYTVKGGNCTQGNANFSYEGSHRTAIYYLSGPQYNNAYYSLYGSASGITRNGLKYTAEVVKDQLKSDQCPCMTAGTTELLPNGYKNKLLNFGEGQCDEIGTFTIAENTIAFKLK